VLSAPHMFEPAPTLSKIPKMPLTISWVSDWWRYFLHPH